MRNEIDKIDVTISVSSGMITSFIDAFGVRDISLLDAHTWGKNEVDSFVEKVAKSRGYSGTGVAGAIRYLEKNEMLGDKLTNEFGGGYNHHLRDFSHHPTLVGLLFSLLMQFTGKGYGTDVSGNFVSYEIKDWERKNPVDCIYMGTVTWLFHIISDMAGSSSSVAKGNEGTGVPGPMLSFLKEISSLPGVKNIIGKAENNGKTTDNYQFSTVCSKLFNGTLLAEHNEKGKIIKETQLRFDLRTELGIVNESITNKQYLPVLLNELFVSASYSVRRFMDEIKKKDINAIKELKNIDIRRCLPWKNDTIRHMRMIANVTFSTVDVTAAGIKAAVNNKNNPERFALDFIKGINYWGLGSLALSTNSEILLGVQKMHEGFVALFEEQKRKYIESVDDGQKKIDTAKYATSTVVSMAKIGTPIGFVSATVGVYNEIKKALDELDESKERRSIVEAQCNEYVAIAEEYRVELEKNVSAYLTNKMQIFTESFAVMDKAISENDIEMYISGNNMIQKEVSGKTIFDNMDEFEQLMMSNNTLKI